MSSSTDAAAAGSPSVQDLAALKARVSHVAYHVADVDRALTFYVGLLGMKEQMRLPLGQGLHEVVLAFPNSQGAGVILMWHAERNAGRTHGDGYSRFVVNVSDVEAAMQHLVKHDTPVVTQITQAGPFKYALVKDPDGYTIELLQMTKS